MTISIGEWSVHVRYIDDFVLVVDKPHGLASQSTQRRGQPSLYDGLRAHYPYVGLHHRLDTPASGLMLFTLNQQANAPVAEAFQTQNIQRRYRLVVAGDPGPSGEWVSPIKGKKAKTKYRRLATHGGMSALMATLETGRTHQIRIHASESGFPLLGDRRYGGAAARLWPRLALHASDLLFQHPKTGEPTRVSSPVPRDLAELWSRLGLRCSPEIATEGTFPDRQS